MKARIWFGDGAWNLEIPGIGWQWAPSFEIIRKQWLAFLQWAK